MSAPVFPSSSDRSELRQHEDTFYRLIRSLLTDVAVMKLGVTSSRANDLLHKLKHVEELRATSPTPQIAGGVRESHAPLFYVVNQHIGWLKQYVFGMSDGNWRDMRDRAESQLEKLSQEIDKEAAALRGVAQTKTAPKWDNRPACSFPEMAPSPPAALPAGETPLAWLAEHSNYELTYSGWDEDPVWQLHSVNGGRNDREWTLRATGSTPEEVLRKAMALSLPSTPRATGPLVPWELKCKREVCAAPECDCPAVTSTQSGGAAK